LEEYEWMNEWMKAQNSEVHLTTTFMWQISTAAGTWYKDGSLGYMTVNA
jgi:hypothetical protein